MKKHINAYYSFIAGLMMVAFSSCTEEAVEPTLSVSVSQATVNAGDQVDFIISGEAETFVIYTGDPGHVYENSYLAIADGKDADLESVVLTQDSLDSLLPWLQQQIDNYNATATDPLVYNDIAAGLQNYVGKTYNYREQAIYEITSELLSELPNVADQIVENYFEDNSTILAPDGGYDTGVSLNRYNPDYTYVYNTPGTYTATVIATNISNKNYSGSGYKDDRTASASEYNFNRVIRQVTITVQ